MAEENKNTDTTTGTTTDKTKTDTKKNSDPAKNKQDAEAKAKEQTSDSQPKVLNDEDFSNPGEVAGSEVWSMSKNILSGANFKKYDYPQILEGTQMQYASGTGNIKIVNFKQDYIVLIRKKLFYAANAQVNMTLQKGDEAGQIGDGHYVRTYKLDNFTALRTSHSIAGSMGTCQIDLQGAERVFCYEHSSVVSAGTPTLSTMVSGEFPDNNAQLAKDVANPSSMGTTTDATQVKNNEDVLAQANKTGESFWNRDDGKSLGGATFKTRKNDDGITGTVYVTQPNGDKYELILPLTQGQNAGDTDGNKNEGLGENHQVSGWKVAEKCDWEPMDEIWVYGKSNFERDSATGDFKMNQIFFGYIDAVTKTHSSGKTAGCTISITGSDQLKLLDLSYVTMNPSMTPGASGSNGLDLRFSAQDAKHFGTFELFNPYAVAQHLGVESAGKASDEQKEALRYSWRNLALTNVFAGKPVSWIIRRLCLDAGIPTWYLKDRIENIQFPPFTYQLKQTSSESLFTATMEKRLQECNKAAKKLLLEFFADEEGNIVLKCPNYALGVNALVKNNMGLNQLEGGLLDQVKIDDVQQYFAVNSKTYLVKKEEKQAEEKAESDKKKGVKTDNGSEDVNKKVKKITPEYAEYLKAKASATVLAHTGGLPQKGAEMMSGSVETNELATYVSNEKSTGGTGNAFATHVIVEGDTLWNLAATYLNDGNRYPEIISSNATVFQHPTDGGSNLTESNASDLYRFVGRTLQINYNNTDSISVLRAKAKKSGYFTLESSKDGKTKDSSLPPETQEQYDNVTRSYYDNTLSELTDALIPEIPQEYIMSFSLTDTDKGIYNMYEVNIEGDFGVFDKGGPVEQLRRVFPDIPSMIRFGCRPMPNTITFPYMGNKENAHMLAFMMVANSLARRNSATMNMIEDSFIKIGNPVRFFAYDEHPDNPIYPQTEKSAMESTLIANGRNGNSGTFAETTSTSLKPVWDSFQQLEKSSVKQESENGKPKAVEKTTTVNATTGTAVTTEGTVTKTNENSQKSTKTTADKTATESAKNDKNNDSQTDKNTKPATDAKAGDKSKNTETDLVDVKPGGDLNQSISAATQMHSSYNGVKASQLAMTTNAQSIYYVEQISRSIGVAKESTMTLTLTCGRMMGKPSCIDHMLLLYKTYYDPMLGYCPDLGKLQAIRLKYDKNTQSHLVLPGDTLMVILGAVYKVDLSESQLSPKEVASEAVPDENSTIVLKDKNAWDKKTYADGWVKRTSEVTGKCYQMIDGKGKLLYEFKYYLYDNDKTAWVFLKKTPTDKDFIWDSETTANVTNGGVESYKEHAEGCITYLMQKEATDKGARSEFRNVADRKDFAEKSPDFQVSAPKATRAQLLAEELMHAIIALNTEVFGSSLEISYTQFELELQQQQGKSIVIPNVLDIGADNAFPKSKSNKKDLTADEKEKYDGRNITKYEYKDGDNAVTEYVEKIDNANSIRKKIIKDSNGNVVETSTERIADDMLSEKTITKKIVDKNGKEKAITTTERYSDAVKGKIVSTSCVVGDFDSSTNEVTNGKQYNVEGKLEVTDTITNSIKDGTYDSVITKETGSQAKTIKTVDTSEAKNARTTNSEKTSSKQEEKSQTTSKEDQQTGNNKQVEQQSATSAAQEMASDSGTSNLDRQNGVEDKFNSIKNQKLLASSSEWKDLQSLTSEYQMVKVNFARSKSYAIALYKKQYGKNPPDGWLKTQEATDYGFNASLGKKMNQLGDTATAQCAKLAKDYNVNLDMYKLDFYFR